MQKEIIVYVCDFCDKQRGAPYVVNGSDCCPACLMKMVNYRGVEHTVKRRE